MTADRLAALLRAEFYDRLLADGGYWEAVPDEVWAESAARLAAAGVTVELDVKRLAQALADDAASENDEGWVEYAERVAGFYGAAQPAPDALRAALASEEADHG